MEAKKDSTSAVAEETDSVVDSVFDALTAWAAKGLAFAKTGLELGAKWLDAQAKKTGELATKLATKQAAPPAT